ncbi:Speckle-type POZ protein like [Argiope bruennichi]|uniref:Speckle-type POZ protein like n=1 Tax=Argiope bruennichi TaxID=94029 RepID=A0A8T0ECB0_ARGBR|nr:Speckle-type POZ protein like [Argiope bruennichi]
MPNRTEPTPAMNSEYLNSLKADLKQYSGASSKEIVNLRVGEETECASKTILCLRSPVFAKMFENDMKELKHNTVTITDIKMTVLRVLVSFLYSGLLPDLDFDFSCHLYYAADKYDIKDLQLACITLLVSKASLENLFQLLKLSLSHNDELLKSVAMTLMNPKPKESLMLMPKLGKLMHEDPKCFGSCYTL